MIRALYFSLGCACLLLGAIGALLPLLPTVPFLILAAFCFSRSSARLHRWLLERKTIGPIIADWEQDGVISLPAKRASTAMILVLVSYPLFFLSFPWQLKVIVVVTITLVLTFIWTRPSQRLPVVSALLNTE